MINFFGLLNLHLITNCKNMLIYFFEEKEEKNNLKEIQLYGNYRIKNLRNKNIIF